MKTIKNEDYVSTKQMVLKNVEGVLDAWNKGMMSEENAFTLVKLFMVPTSVGEEDLLDIASQ